MPLTLNKPYSGLRIASSSNVPVFAPREGFCDGVVLDTPYVGLRASAVDGSPVFLISDQKLEADGTMTIDKPYIGLRASQVDGTLVFLVDGKVCEEEDNPTVCGIERCCTLNASVRIKLTADPTWTDWVDFDLVCGSALSYNDGACCYEIEDEDNTFCYLYDVTTTGKDTLSSPEPYDLGSSSGTRSAKSVFWRGDFEAGGKTYQLVYYVVETHIFQTLPTVVTTDDCIEGFILLEWATSGPAFDFYGPHWNGIGGGLGTVPTWAYTQTFSPPYAGDCPEGFGTSNEFDDDGCSFGIDGCAEIDIVDPCE